MTQYLDENGNPVQSGGKVYLDDNGNPIKPASSPAPSDTTPMLPQGEMRATPTFGERLSSLIHHPLNSMEAAGQMTSRPSGATMGEMLTSDLGNVAAGATNVMRHPLKTVGGILSSGMGARPVVETVANALEAPILEKQGKAPLYEPNLVPKTPEEAAYAGGQALGAAGLGKVAEGGLKSIPKVARTAVEKATKTTPKEAAALVKETKTANAVGDAYSRARAAVETAREKALKTGNEKYSTVNPALNPIQANPEVMENALADATESLKGSHTEPTLLKNIVNKHQRGEGFTYEDLQGDYSRLGKELSKGTLPGDEYHAYDVLHEAIGKEMQRIADSEGMGAQLKDARDYWRRMKQAFGKPLAQTDVATSTLRTLAPEMTEADTIANRIRLMGSFDPEIPKAFEELNAARDAAKKAGVEPTTPGETAKIGPKEIQSKKLRSLEEGTERVRKVGRKIVNYGIGLKALWDAYHLNVASAASDVALGYGGYKTADAFARLLERPEIQEMLTKPTAADIAQIPAELRGNLGPMLDAAKAKGVQVDPRLYAAVGAAQPKKRVASVLTR